MIKRLLCALLALSIPFAALAETSGSLPLLKISPDARSVAMGETGVASTTGAMAVFHNPALIAFADKSQGAFGYSDWLMDLSIQSAALLFKSKGYSFALSANSFNVPDLELRVLPSDDPIETFSAHDFVGGLSFGVKLMDNLSAGVTGRYVFQQIYVSEANGYSIDAGLAYRLDFFNMMIGAAVRNIGQMEKLDEERSPLPTNAAIGLSSNAWDGGDFGLNAAYEVKHYFADDTRFNFGVEGYWKQHLFLRAGYQTGSELRSVSGGAGLAWNRFHFDYAYQPLAEDFEASHRFGLSIDF
ncbi:PorV/PorQ family protein [bacterium]|nr:PorV/PorQ family protein [bacterium]